MTKEKKVVYSEPSDYIPKEIREEYKLGEYSDNSKTITPNEKQLLILKDLLVQEIDYLGPVINKTTGPDKKSLQEELDACIDLLNQIKS